MGDLTTLGSPPLLVRTPSKKIPVRKKHTESQRTNHTATDDEFLAQVMNTPCCRNRLRAGSSKSPGSNPPNKNNARRTPPQRPSSAGSPSSSASSARSTGSKPANKTGAGEGRKTASPVGGAARNIRAAARPKGDSVSPSGSIRNAARQSPQQSRVVPSPPAKRTPPGSKTSQPTPTSPGISTTSASITTSSSGRSSQISKTSAKPAAAPKRVLANTLQNRTTVQHGAKVSAAGAKKTTPEKANPNKAKVVPKTSGNRSPVAPKIAQGSNTAPSRGQPTSAVKARQNSPLSTPSARSSPQKVTTLSKQSLGSKAAISPRVLTSAKSIQSAQLSAPKSLTQRSGSSAKAVSSGKKWINAARPHTLTKPQMSNIVVKTTEKITDRQSSNRSLQVTSRTPTSSHEVRQLARPQMSAHVATNPHSQQAVKSQHSMYPQANFPQSGYAGQQMDYNNYYQPYYDERYGWVWNVNPNYNTAYNNTMWQGGFPVGTQGAYQGMANTGTWNANAMPENQKSAKKESSDAEMRAKTSIQASPTDTWNAMPENQKGTKKETSDAEMKARTSIQTSPSTATDKKPDESAKISVANKELSIKSSVLSSKTNVSSDISHTVPSVLPKIVSEKSIHSIMEHSSINDQINIASTELEKTPVPSRSVSVERRDFVELKETEHSSSSATSEVSTGDNVSKSILYENKQQEKSSKEIIDSTEVNDGKRKSVEHKKDITWAMSFSDKSVSSEKSVVVNEGERSNESKSLSHSSILRKDSIYLGQKDNVSKQPGLVFALNTPSSVHSLSAKIASESMSKELQKAKIVSSLSVGSKQLPEDRHPLLSLDENSRFLEQNDDPVLQSSDGELWGSPPSSYSHISVKSYDRESYQSAQEIDKTSTDKQPDVQNLGRIDGNILKVNVLDGIVHGEIEMNLNQSLFPQGKENTLKEDYYIGQEKIYNQSLTDKASEKSKLDWENSGKTKTNITTIDELMNMKYKQKQDNPMTEQFVHTKSWTTTDGLSSPHLESVVHISSTAGEYPFLGQQYVEKKESKRENMLEQDVSMMFSNNQQKEKFYQSQITENTENRETSFPKVLTSKSYAEKDALKGFALIHPDNENSKPVIVDHSNLIKPPNTTEHVSSNASSTSEIMPQGRMNYNLTTDLQYDWNFSNQDNNSLFQQIEKTQLPSIQQYPYTQHQLQELQQQFQLINNPLTSDWRNEQIPNQHYMQAKSSLTMSSDQVKPDLIQQSPTVQPNGLASVVLSQMQRSLSNRGFDPGFDQTSSSSQYLDSSSARDQFSQMQQAFTSSLLESKGPISNLANTIMNKQEETNKMWSSSTLGSSTADSDNSLSNVFGERSKRMIRTPEGDLIESDVDFSERLNALTESYAASSSSVQDTNNGAYTFNRSPLAGNNTGATQFTMTRGTVAETPRVPPPPAEQLPRASYVLPLPTMNSTGMMTDFSCAGTNILTDHDRLETSISTTGHTVQSTRAPNLPETTPSLVTPILSTKEDSSSLFYKKFLSVHNTLEAPRSMLINSPSSELTFDDMDSPGTSGETSSEFDSQSNESVHKEKMKEFISNNMVFGNLKSMKLEIEANREKIKQDEKTDNGIGESIKSITKMPQENLGLKESNLPSSGEQSNLSENQSSLLYSAVTTMPVAPYGDGLRRGNPPAGARKASSVVDLDEDEDLTQEDNSRTSAPALQDSVPNKNVYKEDHTVINGAYKYTVSDTRNRIAAERTSFTGGPQSLTNLSTTESSLAYTSTEGSSTETINKLFLSKLQDERNIKTVDFPQNITELQEFYPGVSIDKSDHTQQSESLVDQKVSFTQKYNEEGKSGTSSEESQQSEKDLSSSKEGINEEKSIKDEQPLYKREYFPEIIGHRFLVTATDPKVEQNLGNNTSVVIPPVNTSLQSLSFESTLNESLQSLEGLADLKSSEKKILKQSLLNKKLIGETSQVDSTSLKAREKEIKIINGANYGVAKNKLYENNISSEDSIPEFLKKMEKYGINKQDYNEAKTELNSFDQKDEDYEERESPFVLTRMIGSDVDQLSSQSSEEVHSLTPSSKMSSTHSLSPKVVITPSGRFIDFGNKNGKTKQEEESDLLPKLDASLNVNNWLSRLPSPPVEAVVADDEQIGRRSSSKLSAENKTYDLDNQNSSEYWEKLLSGAVHLSLGVGMPLSPKNSHDSSSLSYVNKSSDSNSLRLPFRNDDQANAATSYSLSEATFFDVNASRVNSDISDLDSSYKIISAHSAKDINEKSGLDRDENVSSRSLYSLAKEVPSIFLNVHSGRVNSDIFSDDEKSEIEMRQERSNISEISPYSLLVEKPSVYLNLDTQRTNSDVSTTGSFQEPTGDFEQKVRFASDIIHTISNVPVERMNSDISAETFGEDGRLSRLLNTSEISQNLQYPSEQNFTPFAAPFSTPALILNGQNGVSEEMNVPDVMATTIITSFLPSNTTELDNNNQAQYPESSLFSSPENQGVQFYISTMLENQMDNSAIITSFIPAPEAETTPPSYQYYNVPLQTERVEESINNGEKTEISPVITDFVPARDANVEQANFTWQNYFIENPQTYSQTYMHLPQYGDGRSTQRITASAAMENVEINRGVNADNRNIFSSVPFISSGLIQPPTIDIRPSQLYALMEDQIGHENQSANMQYQAPTAANENLNYSHVNTPQEGIGNDQLNLYLQSALMQNVTNMGSGQVRNVLLDKIRSLIENECNFSQVSGQQTTGNEKRQTMSMPSNYITTETQQQIDPDRKADISTTSSKANFPLPTAQKELTNSSVTAKSNLGYSQYLEENLEIGTDSQHHPKIFGQSFAEGKETVPSRTGIVPNDFPAIIIIPNAHDIVKKKGTADGTISPTGSQGGIMETASSISLGMPGADKLYSPNTIYDIDFLNFPTRSKVLPWYKSADMNQILDTAESAHLITASMAAENLEMNKFLERTGESDKGESNALVLPDIRTNAQTQSSDSVSSSKTITDETHPRGVVSLPLEPIEIRKSSETVINARSEIVSAHELTPALPFISLNVDNSKTESEGSVTPVLILSESDSEYTPSRSGEGIAIEGPSIDKAVAVLNSLNLIKSKPKSSEGVILRMTPIPVVPDDKSSTEITTENSEDDSRTSSEMSFEREYSEEEKIVCIKDKGQGKKSRDKVEPSISSLTSSGTSKEETLTTTSSDVSDFLRDVQFEESMRGLLDMTDKKSRMGLDQTPESFIEIVKDSSLIESVTDSSVIDSVTDSSVIELVTDSSVIESVKDSSVIEIVKDSSLIESVKDSSVIEIVKDSSLIESVKDSSLIESVKDSSVIESVKDSSVIKIVKDSSLIESVKDPSVIEIVKDSSSLIESVKDSSVIEIKDSSSLIESVKDSSVIEIVKDSSSLIESVKDPSVIEIVKDSSSLIESVKDSSVIEIVTNSSVIDSVTDSSVIEIVKDSSVIESVKDSSVIEIKDSSVIEGVKDSSTSNATEEALEVSQKLSAVEQREILNVKKTYDSETSEISLEEESKNYELPEYLSETDAESLSDSNINEVSPISTDKKKINIEREAILKRLFPTIRLDTIKTMPSAISDPKNKKIFDYSDSLTSLESEPDSLAEEVKDKCEDEEEEEQEEEGQQEEQEKDQEEETVEILHAVEKKSSSEFEVSIDEDEEKKMTDNVEEAKTEAPIEERPSTPVRGRLSPKEPIISSLLRLKLQEDNKKTPTKLSTTVTRQTLTSLTLADLDLPTTIFPLPTDMVPTKFSAIRAETPASGLASTRENQPERTPSTSATDSQTSDESNLSSRTSQMKSKDKKRHPWFRWL